MCDGNCCNQKDVQFLVLRKDCHGDFWVHPLVAIQGNRRIVKADNGIEMIDL